MDHADNSFLYCERLNCHWWKNVLTVNMNESEAIKPKDQLNYAYTLQGDRLNSVPSTHIGTKIIGLGCGRGSEHTDTSNFTGLLISYPKLKKIT